MTIVLTATETEIEQSVILASKFNFSGFVAAFKSSTVQQKIAAGEDVLNLALGVAGLFFPPAAVAASDAKIVELALNLIVPLLFGANPLIKFEPLIAVSGGWGGFVAPEWATNPRERLTGDDFTKP